MPFRDNPAVAVPLIALLCVVLNLPLGYLRARVKEIPALRKGVGMKILRFGIILFLIHAAIPVVIFLRWSAGLSGWKVITLFITASIAGQIVGARLRKKREGNAGT
jgi:hypothetical protein